MTLGCGGYGGNITSDNISPRHLLNIKRLAYEIAPADTQVRPHANTDTQVRPHAAGTDTQVRPSALPAAPQRPAMPVGITADALNRRIDEFLASRGYGGREPVRGSEARTGDGSAAVGPPLDFVCEEDVRLAIQAGRKLVVSERAIVTPAARDLGEQHRVFSVAPWRG